MPEEQNPKESDKAEDTVKRRKKPPEYRRFEKLLKQVIKAPPLRKPPNGSRGNRSNEVRETKS